MDAATADFEDRVRAWEASSSPSSATPSYPARRRVEEPDSPLRTPFQRDRDRIVHSKAFRRLKHKTQVFIAPEGDHYRTRLTHTLEACGIARTVARALGLNEDLTEAIGLGHDLGHPPFGHTGEEALDAALRERCESGLQAQRALAAGGRRARARRPGPQPDRAGPRRHPQPHRVATSRRRWRGGSSSWSTASPTSTTTSTTRCGPGILRPGRPAGRRDRAARARPARRGSTRWSATSSTAPPPRGDIAQSEEIGGAMLRLRKFMFDRVYLGPRRRAASTSGCAAPCAASSTTTWSTPRRCRRASRGRATASASPTTSPG